MKKTIAMLLAIIMALTLCACGGTSESADGDSWAYEDYMTEEEYSQLSVAVEEYIAGYNDLMALIEKTKIQLDDQSLAAVNGIPGDIETLNTILDDPSSMTGDMTAAELIEITQAQRDLVLSFITQINAIVG